MLFPKWIQIQYSMKELVYSKYIHLEMRWAVWGLPPAGILANKRLRQKLALFGYFKHVNTPGLWYHELRPISFTLVVDNFGVKYKNKDDVDHLVARLKPRTHSPRIGPVICIERLHLPGITSTGWWISQCLVISRKNYKNIDTFNWNIPRRVRTCRHQSNLGQKHKLPFQPTFPPASTKKASIICNALWGAFCIMLAPLIWLF